MKNNTIAIALGSLLLGGVATAGYLNNRDKTSDIQPPSDAAAAQYADAFGEPLPMDSAIPASGRVEYAQVVGVEPVLERKKLYATVIGSEPVARPEAVKKMWEYIKAHNLQDPKDKRTIVADDKLRAVFGKDSAGMFELAGILGNHLGGE